MFSSCLLFGAGQRCQCLINVSPACHSSQVLAISPEIVLVKALYQITMCELTWVSLLLALLMPLAASLIVPMSKPNGDADLISITSHVTLMEQTVNSLEARFQTTKTELTTVKADLKTTRTELSSLQLQHIDAVRDLTVTQTQLNDALAELHTVKDDLKKAESELALVNLQSLNLSELTNLKTELKTVRTELSAARSESNGTSSEQRSIRRELARLTSNVKAQNALINETVLDAISSDVKSNLAEIVLLKSELSLTRGDTNKTACEVEIIQDYLNSSIVAVGDLEKELTSLIETMDNATLEANTTQGEVSQLMKSLHDLGQSVEDHSNTLNNISFSIGEYTCKLSATTCVDGVVEVVVCIQLQLVKGIATPRFCLK